jgi:alpha-galactosidase
MQTARALVENGLAAKGYTYVNIDDCWQVAREENTGRIIADPVTFPSGIKALADYVHSYGLKLGIYRFLYFII